jgi:hypothetical protein
MKNSIKNLMKDSKLNYKGSISDDFSSKKSSSLFLTSSKNLISEHEHIENVNFALLPKINESSSTTSSNLIQYKGISSMDHVIKKLLHEVLSVKRARSSFTSGPINTTTAQQQQFNTLGSQFISEKRWFAYANKIWEKIRKSPLIGEYNRLMT